jgi:ATP-binding cassette, subfamily B, bacterial
MSSDHKTLVRQSRHLLSKLSYLPRTLRLVWKAAPQYTLAWFVLLLVQGLLPVASIYLIKLLIDGLLAAAKTHGAWEYVRPTIVTAVFAAGIILLTEFLQGLSDWIRTAQSELIQDHIKELIHQQSAQVDLAFYESPEYYDRLDQARTEAASRPLALLESGGSLIQNSISFLAMATVLTTYSLWLPLVLLLSTLPAFYVVLRFDRRYYHWWRQTTSERRWTQYYDAMLTHSMAAAEVRLFGLGAHFRSAYQTLRQRLRTERLAQVQKQSVARVLASCVALLISGASLAWMSWRTLHGLATLGDLALFYQVFNRGQDLMRSLLGSVGKVYTNSLFLENLFAFLDLKPSVIDPTTPVPAPSVLSGGINFRKVTFRYPGSQHAALKNFSLFIPAGKVVAIVGTNGAGKTTLLKLLCRFYDPQSGRIELDGIDLRKLSISELWRMITVLFQQPLNYHATAGQTVALGDISKSHGSTEIEAAARSAGAHELITRLPHGYDTLLGKWFDGGVELSGGEWQRINMARAYMRQAPIILLDEPTSFMDSWVEAEWFERFRTLTAERTAIVITHRFTIAMRADIIHVMHEGEIVESGTHHELLAQGGLYAQSWTRQMQSSSDRTNEVSRPPYGDDPALQEIACQ